MPIQSNLSGVPRRALPIFYVLDTSASMRESGAIEILNNAMAETVDALSQIGARHEGAQLKIAVLQFNTTCQWLAASGPEDIEDFIWPGLPADGMTYMGGALRELNDKLRPEGFLDSATGGWLPVIIFMTDGRANDDYREPLKTLEKNPYFRRAIKVGFALGDKADARMIAEVVGDTEAVIQTEDLGLFASLIRFVSVTSSMMASTTHPTDADPTGADVINTVIDDIGIDKDTIKKPAAGTTGSSKMPGAGNTKTPNSDPDGIESW